MAQPTAAEQLTRRITGKLAAELNPQTESEMVFCREAISALYFFIEDHNLGANWEKVVKKYISIAREPKNSKLSAYQIMEAVEAALKKEKTNSSTHQL